MSGEGARDTVALTPQEHTGEPIYQSILPGQVLAGKYRVLHALGKGGMGVVVAAEHIDLHERVALKLMLPDALASDDAMARFLREARAAVKIKGEHVARVLDVGKLETGEPYIVMEYLEGTDLGALLDRKGPLPIKEAVEYLLQACEALAEAHALGIIHRDLKPANLFLARRPDRSALVKVLDFGISKIMPRRSSQDPVDVSITNTRQILGTPLYMAPEQLDSSRNADMTSDIWSLGAILFELLTGAVPFDGKTLQELRRRIRAEPAPALRSHRQDAPRELEEVVQRCLEKDPAKRYPNVAELATALSAFAPSGARVSVKRIHRMIDNAGLGATTPQELAAPESAQASERPGESVARPNQRRPPVAVGIALVVIVIGWVVGGILFLREPTAKPEADISASPRSAETSDQETPRGALPTSPLPPVTAAPTVNAPPIPEQSASAPAASAPVVAAPPGGKARPKAPTTAAPGPSSTASPTRPPDNPLDYSIH
jgi:serine/threonine-protein kinase